MTEEAIKWFEDNMPEWDYEGNLYCAEPYYLGEYVCTEPEGYVYREAIKALEKAEKYKWHDLRKDPEDIPEVGKPFVYAFRTQDLPNRVLYNSAMGFESEVEIVKHQGNGYAEYIAWKYFEPFEEV